MKLTDKILKDMIREAISENLLEEENPQSVGTQQLRQQGVEGSKQVTKLSPRERQVVGALQNIQRALQAQGEQASQKVVMLVKRLLDELEKGQKVSTQGDTQ